MRRYLAWQSILADAEALNLDAHQRKEAATSLAGSNTTVDGRLKEAYSWLLVPTQEGTDPVTWECIRISGGTENHVVKASRQMKTSELLITK